jgi:hypothetical protein
MAAGKSLSEGKYTKQNLLAIFRWKTGGRGITRIDHNSPQELAEALCIAAQSKTSERPSQY